MPGIVVTREDRLRAGHQERVFYGGQVLLYLYLEPHYDSQFEIFVQDFCIEWGDGRKQYIHSFDEAVKEFERLERDFIMKEMARALIG